MQLASGSTAARESIDSKAIDIATGTWLGFHDGDTPLLAKLAVHDRQNDRYIFVNRIGIKMRELTTREFKALLASDLVDILASGIDFREEVMRAKRQAGT
jgi:hypothetical protein